MKLYKIWAMTPFASPEYVASVNAKSSDDAIKRAKEELQLEDYQRVSLFVRP